MYLLPWVSGSFLAEYSTFLGTIKVRIIFHIPDEYERFQTRIGRWSIEDVAATIEKNKTREAYGSVENTISLIIPKGKSFMLAHA